MFLKNYGRNYGRNFLSVNPLVIKNIITDVSIPSVNPSIIIFFITNGFTDRQKITDK
jgi:hypothetical protein